LVELVCVVYVVFVQIFRTRGVDADQASKNVVNYALLATLNEPPSG
jgi:hypothetical protein